MYVSDAHAMYVCILHQHTCVYNRVRQYKCIQNVCKHTPLVSLADCLIRVGCELLVLLVDAVVGEVGKPVGEGLGGGGVPGASKQKRETGETCTSCVRIGTVQTMQVCCMNGKRFFYIS